MLPPLAGEKALAVAARRASAVWRDCRRAPGDPGDLLLAAGLPLLRLLWLGACTPWCELAPRPLGTMARQTPVLPWVLLTLRLARLLGSIRLRRGRRAGCSWRPGQPAASALLLTHGRAAGVEQCEARAAPCARPPAAARPRTTRHPRTLRRRLVFSRSAHVALRGLPTRRRRRVVVVVVMVVVVLVVGSSSSALVAHTTRVGGALACRRACRRACRHVRDHLLELQELIGEAPRRRPLCSRERHLCPGPLDPTSPLLQARRRGASLVASLVASLALLAAGAPPVFIGRVSAVKCAKV